MAISRGIGRAAPLATAATVAIAVPVSAASAGDSPAGFWYGTDSSTMSIPGHVPYQVPAIGGNYGGYIGMAGNWANLAGCYKIVVWSATNASQALANYNAHEGVGTGVYWFMGGPGVDRTTTAHRPRRTPGAGQQAARTIYDISHLHITYPVAFMDIEIPGNSPSCTPAPDNGWNTVYTSACSGKVRSYHIPAAVDRADLNGFIAYLTSHSRYKAGVYSAPDVWAAIFGTGTAAWIPNTYEWTYEPFTSSLWQWSGGGGSCNGYGDFDQIDSLRTP